MAAARRAPRLGRDSRRSLRRPRGQRGEEHAPWAPWPLRPGRPARGGDRPRCPHRRTPPAGHQRPRHRPRRRIPVLILARLAARTAGAGPHPHPAPRLLADVTRHKHVASLIASARARSRLAGGDFVSVADAMSARRPPHADTVAVTESERSSRGGTATPAPSANPVSSSSRADGSCAAHRTPSSRSRCRRAALSSRRQIRTDSWCPVGMHDHASSRAIGVGTAVLIVSPEVCSRRRGMS